MEPTGIKTYKGYEIRYYDTGNTIKLNTGDYLKVVPKVAEHLIEGDFLMFDIEVAGPAASSYGGDAEFADWIQENFNGPPRDYSEE